LDLDSSDAPPDPRLFFHAYRFFNMAATFETPTLAINQILTHCREADIDVTENDLKRPDPRRWRQIYSSVFECLTTRSIEQATQSLCRNVQLHTHHPELYEEGFAQVAFTMCMQRVLATCKFEDFSLEDIIAPTPKRLVKALSAFINFMNHAHLRQAFFDEEKEKVERSKEKFESVQHRNSELKNRLSRMKEREGQMNVEKQQCQDELDQGSQCLERLVMQQQAIRKETEELDLSKAEREKDIENIKQHVQEVQRDMEKLSQKIVQSPERFKQEQDRLNKRVHELKDELCGKEQTLIENRTLLEQTKGKKLAGARAVKLSVEVHKAIEEELVIDAEIQKLTEQHNELVYKDTQYFKREEDLGEKLRHRQDQRRTLLMQVDMKKTGQQQRLQEYKGLKDKINQCNVAYKTEVENLQRSTASLEIESENVKQQVEEAQQTLDLDITGYMKEVKDINNGFDKVYCHCKTILKDDVDF